MESTYCIVKKLKIAITAKDYKILSISYDVEEIAHDKIYWTTCFQGEQPTMLEFESDIKCEADEKDANGNFYTTFRDHVNVQPQWLESYGDSIIWNWRLSGFDNNGRAYWSTAKLYPSEYNFEGGGVFDGGFRTIDEILLVKIITKSEYDILINSKSNDAIHNFIKVNNLD